MKLIKMLNESQSDMEFEKNVKFDQMVEDLDKLRIMYNDPYYVNDRNSINIRIQSLRYKISRFWI